jgi:hypothetical protein
VTQLKDLRDRSIHIDDAKDLPEDELENRFVVGKLIERKRAEFGDGLQELIAKRREALSEELEGGLRQDTSAMETGR